MTVSKQGLVNPVGAELVTLEQANPGVGVARTAEQIASGSKKVLAVEIDNTGNTAISYLKLWSGGGMTVGSTDPVCILRADGSSKVQYTFDVGFTIVNAYAATLTTKGTTGNVAPEATITARFLLE